MADEINICINTKSVKCQDMGTDVGFCMWNLNATVNKY